jgi:Ca-activated chloride channel family protein
MSVVRILSGVLLAGFIAERLAAPDADVEAGIVAYEAGDYDEALARFDAAVERRGDRPELSFDRGLALLAKEDGEAARTAFLHATESERPDVRSSAFYELGNLALDAEDWDGAIEAYIDCLKARPDHANAKWNLELALQKKEEQEKKDEEEKQDEEEKDEEEKDEDEKQEDEKQEDEKQEDEKQEDEKQDDQKQDDQKQDDQKQDDQKQDDQKQDDQKQDDQKQDDQKQEPPAAPPQRPLDRMDIDRALDDLDSQDDFALDRPIGRPQAPSKDW